MKKTSEKLKKGSRKLKKNNDEEKTQWRKNG